jgi:predicted DNA-binding WGR domain protein
MSHNIAIKTAIKDGKCLVRALERLGFKGQVEVHEFPQHLYGYQGDMRKEKAHVIVRRKHVGSSSNDIGFENVGGFYTAYISEFDEGTGTYSGRHDTARCNKVWQNKLLVHYGVEVAKLECEKKKIRYEEYVDPQDDQQRIQLKTWL